MIRLVTTAGVFLNCLLLLAAEERHVEPDPVTWENAFRPIYFETAHYPRATTLADGRLLVAFAHPTPAGKAVACLFSSDGGKTWTNYRRISEHSRPIDLDNAFPLQLADGTVLGAYRRHDRQRHADGPDDPANWNALYTGNDGTVLALSNHCGRIWGKTGTIGGKPKP